MAEMAHSSVGGSGGGEVDGVRAGSIRSHWLAVTQRLANLLSIQRQRLLLIWRGEGHGRLHLGS